MSGEAFRRIFVPALLAGCGAGLVLALVQLAVTTPLIVAAEAFEAGHTHAGSLAQRAVLTGLSSVVFGVGLGLVLNALIALSGREVDWRLGAGWGLAGFAAFVLAPAVGLPPELPGMAGADLSARQGWWLATVLASAAGLWLIFLTGGARAIALGLALLLAPHVIGAPQAPEIASQVPAHLAARYVASALALGAVFWSVLGALSGLFARRA